MCVPLLSLQGKSLVLIHTCRSTHLSISESENTFNNSIMLEHLLLNEQLCHNIMTPVSLQIVCQLYCALHLSTHIQWIWDLVASVRKWESELFNIRSWVTCMLSISATACKVCSFTWPCPGVSELAPELDEKSINNRLIYFLMQICSFNVISMWQKRVNSKCSFEGM